jgi:hypothetical protein
LIKSYSIEGKTVKFIIPRKGEDFECFCDLEDLDKVLEFPWNVIYRKNIDGYYVSHTHYISIINGKVKAKTYLLHKYIMNTENNKNIAVNHIIAKDTLNNKRENLRVSKYEDNSKNRKGKNSNNTSGYRNVSLDKKSNEWCVQLQINKKNTCLKRFPYEQLHEAGAYAKEMREYYYGKFAGND